MRARSWCAASDGDLGPASGRRWRRGGGGSPLFGILSPLFSSSFPSGDLLAHCSMIFPRRRVSSGTRLKTRGWNHRCHETLWGILITHSKEVADIRLSSGLAAVPAPELNFTRLSGRLQARQQSRMIWCFWRCKVFGQLVRRLDFFSDGYGEPNQVGERGIQVRHGIRPGKVQRRAVYCLTRSLCRSPVSGRRFVSLRSAPLRCHLTRRSCA